MLAIDDMDFQEKIAYQIIEKDLSVRQIENYVNTYKKQTAAEKKEKQVKFNIAKAEIENSLSSALGTKVKISEGKNKGKIEIEFYDNESLNKIVNILRKEEIKNA